MCIILMAAGPMITTNRQGRKKRIMGTVSFAGSEAAFCSAACIRISRFSCDVTRSAWPIGVKPLAFGSNQIGNLILRVMIPPAQATGRLTLITGAMAREIVVGKDGKAESVSYVDKATRSEKRVYAKAFIDADD